MKPVAFHDGWGVRPKTNPFFEIGQAVAFDPVTVPHDAMRGRGRDWHTPGGALTGYIPGGDVEYRAFLDLDDAAVNRRHYLEFEGLQANAIVRVNGAMAGSPATPYTPIVVPLDPLLNEGRNEIRVECTVEQDARWYPGQGLYRPVTLHIGPLTHLAVHALRVSTLTLDDASAALRVRHEIRNDASRRSRHRYRVSILDDGREVAHSGGTITVPPGERAALTARIHLPHVRRWDPADPHLYLVRVELLDDDGSTVDVDETTYGIRSVQVDPVHGLRINGQTTLLRGACVHHDNGPIGAATFAAAEARRVRLLKEAGFNAIRSAHNPISRAMLDACDREGMLVMDELFDTWTSSKARLTPTWNFERIWRDAVDAMVTQDINHPSVILYSIGNEIPETGNPLDAPLTRALVDRVRALDDTRLVTNCINPLYSVISEVTTTRRLDGTRSLNDLLTAQHDFAAEITASELVDERTEEALAPLDVVGYNYAEARYESDGERHPQRVIVGSESSRRHIAERWALVTRLPHVIGDFCWTGWDYLGEAGIGRDNLLENSETGALNADYPYLAAASGDIDLIGRRRASSFYREIVFGVAERPYIAVHVPHDEPQSVVPGMWGWDEVIDSWSWPGWEGKKLTVDVYSSAERVRLFLDDVEIGETVVGSQRPHIATFTVDYAPGTLQAEEIVDGVARTRAITTADPHTLRIRAKAEGSATLLLEAGALAFVPIMLADAAGTVDPSSQAEVTVTVTGPGVLVGLGSADPRPTQSLVATTRSTHEGRLLAVVHPTSPGTIVVEADGGTHGRTHVEINVRNAS